MGKTHRGVLLKKEVPRSGRGYCEVTRRTGVKLLYDYEFNGKKIKVSKLGRAILENRRKREEKSGKAAANQRQEQERVASAAEAEQREAEVQADGAAAEKTATENTEDKEKGDAAE